MDRFTILLTILFGLHLGTAFLFEEGGENGSQESGESRGTGVTRSKSLLMLRDPSYFVVTPRIVRAGHSYRLVVNVLPPSPNLVVVATLLKDNIQVDVVEKTCRSESPELFEIKVPSSITHGKYILKLEGNEVGWLTGSAFANETDLVFSPRGATVFIQMEKKILKQGDTVRMRIVALDGSVTLVEDAVDVFVLSPRGVLVKRWLSRQSREGAVSLEFPLSAETEPGTWKVRVEATNTFAEEEFVVEDFDNPLFEVQVDVPAFLSTSNADLEGTVSANYSSGAPVVGNVTVWATLKPLSKQSPTYYTTKPMLLYKRLNFNGNYHFRFRLADLRDFLSWSPELEVKIEATVGDVLFETTNSGFGTVRIFGREINLDFLGDSPFVINPSMDFQYHLVASMGDGSPIPRDRLLHHRLRVVPEVRFRSGESRRLKSRELKMNHRQYGLWTDEMDLTTQLGPMDFESRGIEYVTLKAELKDATGDRTRASLIAIPRHASRGRNLQVFTSTKNPRVGEYVILHVRSNFYVEKFRYIVMSKGIVMTAGQEWMEASLRTFPLALSAEMAGSATIIVYSIARDQDVVADALSFPVDGLTSTPLGVQMEQRPLEGSVRLSVLGEPGSRVSLLGTHADLYHLQKESELTKEKIVNKIMSDARVVLEPGISSVPWESQDPLTHRWTSPDEESDRVVRRVWAHFGTDTNDTFESTGLRILSDGGIPTRPTPCKKSRGLDSCLLGGCYSSINACDDKFDCVDRIDEKGCKNTRNGVLENLASFHLRRNSRVSRHFGNSWLWSDLVLDENGTGAITVMMPDRSSEFVVSGFALHPKSGRLSLMENPVSIKLDPPFWVWVEAPSDVGIWEQVGVRVTFVNKLNKALPATVVLADNPNYRFVNLEEFAMTFPNKIRPESRRRVRWVLGSDQKHAITIPGHQARTIYLPIVPVILGTLTLTIEASVPGSKITKSTQLNVQPVGALQERHTSFLIDLRTRAYLFTFLDAIGPSIGRGHGDSPTKTHVSLFGDVVGGVADDVVTSENALNLPSMGCEPVAFSILMTIVQLNYWKELKQVPAKDDRDVLERVSLLYQTLISYQNLDGGFKYFRTSPTSSVWVTSLSVRALSEASTKWQKYLYVDPQVTDRAIRFLLTHQSNTGAFWEPLGQSGIRILESPSRLILSENNTKNLNLSITALTLIQLLSLTELPEPLDVEVLTALSKGRMWLEKNIDVVGSSSHPLEISLVTLALHLLKSPEADNAFEILARNARHHVKYVYWGEDFVPRPSFRVESQRPILLPRRLQKHDSGNVAATACALRVYAARGEILTPGIVRWLHSQRTRKGGWSSTLGTLLAWESLYQYSRLKNNAVHTQLTVTVEALTNYSRPNVFVVKPQNVLHLQDVKFNDFEGNVRVQGKGNGSAVLHMSTQYYVSESRHLQSPPVQSYKLSTKVTPGGKNSSTLTFLSCIKWINLDFSETSGISVLEVSIPTGYGVTPEVIKRIVSLKKVPGLNRAQVLPRKVAFYFEKIGTAKTCVEFSVDRWFPVANLSKVLVVKAYEYYSPELFETELLDVSSFTLDICDVCGSYQCQNCPILSYFTSGAQNSLQTSHWGPASTLIVASFLLSCISDRLSSAR